ncbi:uncharacterized protein K452DRAFT_244126 [Aplosporella prunicola CBS 121167]|uniref:Uncharacterized protein n=1 Tax=Aplosporella prunicola CBS 121167 TaxID=1176127 RepID=A0A6A6BSI6_9PEZI|nr:uncharacterized protein K452DRAFT_244126 [Aplosporella prunicola CBS 121167]KAF2145787.1 hypothetical protein K452DRAFT_244126 [Aplosporella prunicola CBS 121167]
MASPAASMPRLLSQRLLSSTSSNALLFRRGLPTTTTTTTSAQPALRRPASTKAKDGTTPSSKQQPIVLEKPDKFRPPSHPARLPRKTPRYQYGPQLTDAQRMAQRTKKYPHMMPPEGTFMHWFLTNRMLHAYISLFVLLTLAFSTFTLNFVHTTPYAALLPSRSDFLAHPLRSLRQALAVYKMHAEHVSAETAERRKRKVDDIDKRNEFKRAHGIDVEEGGKGLLGGLLGGEAKEAQAEEASPVAPAVPAPAVEGEEKTAYTDFEGRKRPVRKWLGIW